MTFYDFFLWWVRGGLAMLLGLFLFVPIAHELLADAIPDPNEGFYEYIAKLVMLIALVGITVTAWPFILLLALAMRIGNLLEEEKEE